MTKLKKYIKRYTSISSAIDTLCRKELALLDPQSWDDRNDRYFMGLYKEFAKASGLYAACFTQSTETYHHWRVFGGGDNGACIEFKLPEFKAHIKGNEDIRAGKVEYLLLTEAEQLSDSRPKQLPFMKRAGFEPEDEYRVIAVSGDPQSPSLGLPIDLKLINRITINPWLPDSIYKSVKSILKNIEDCDHIEITRSSLIDSQRWKNAGNQVVGKPKMGQPVLKISQNRGLPRSKPAASKASKLTRR